MQKLSAKVFVLAITRQKFDEFFMHEYYELLSKVQS